MNISGFRGGKAPRNYRYAVTLGKDLAYFSPYLDTTTRTFMFYGKLTPSASHRDDGSFLVVVPTPPATNKRMKGGRVERSKKGNLYSTVRTTEISKAYQQLVFDAAMERRLVSRTKPFTEDLDVTLNWYRPSKTGDITDRWKDLFDGMECAAYVNDKQIRRLTIERFDNDGKRNSRCEILIKKWAAL